MADTRRDERRRRRRHHRRRLSGPAGRDPARSRNLPERALQREPLRVLDRGQARHRDADRQLEDLLREVQHLLRLPSRHGHLPERGRDRANQVQGYDCVSTGTQDMPPSWTNNTDPNVDFDTQGRAYQVTLPFNAFWEGGLHPNGAIDVSYSDDLGAHWIKGNGGQDLEPNNNQTSLCVRPRRGQAVDRRQPLRRHPVPGSRLRGLDDVQRRGRERQDPTGRLRATAGRRSARRSRSRLRA